MLNAIMNVIVEEEIYDQQYIDGFTENWPAMKAHLADFTPEKMAPICGIEADVLRAIARDFATAKAGMIFWGMGISAHPRHRQFALPDLARAHVRHVGDRARAYPAAAARQRSGRLRRWSDPDVPARLSVGGGRRRALGSAKSGTTRTTLPTSAA